MGKIKDLTGKQFGRLTAVERMPPHGKNSCYMWVCKCECGGTAIVRGSDLTNGHTMSCGCYRRMQRAIPNSQLRLHRIWANMKQRCTNPKTKDFRYYGARGILVCEEWQDFESFFYWAMSNGYQDGLTIERKNNDGNYEPSNCEWIPKNRQQRNTSRTKRYTYCGKVFTLAELCRIFGVPRSTVADRLKKGKTLEESLKIRRNGLNNRLYELSDKLRDLKTGKAELDTQLKSVNAEIDSVIAEMIEIMTTDELDNFSRNGMNFSLVTTEYPSPEPSRKGELWETMKKHGYEALFTINSQTLQATVKEMMENNGGVLPEFLDGLIKVAEKHTIRMAKKKNY